MVEDSERQSQNQRDDQLIDRIGRVTRMLHESMRELGLDREVEHAAKAIPDARDRLSYIADMTQDAAETTLSCVEKAQPLQRQLGEQAASLDSRWAEWFETPKDLGEARELVRETRAYLQAVPDNTGATGQELHKIMMAQDFQDLTGQVIKKLSDVIHDIEHALVDALLEHRPERPSQSQADTSTSRPAASEADSLLNGPQIHKDRDDSNIVTDQSQVDDLLDSLGF